MKQFIAPAYTFTPGVSGVGTVDLSGIDDFEKKNLVSIINQTRGVVIYSTASTSLRYTAVSGTTVTLFFDTSTHNAADVLQAIYETSDATYYSGSVTANNTDFFVIDCFRIRQILLQVTSIGGGGTYAFQCCDEPTFATTNTQWAVNVTTLTNTATAAAVGLFQISPSARYVRVRTTAYTSGTLTMIAFGLLNPVPPIAQSVIALSGSTTAVTTVTSVVASNRATPQSVTDQASAAITTTATSSSITPGQGTAQRFVVSVTAVSGTAPTFDLAIEESGDAGTNWIKIYDFPRITATGHYTSPLLQLRGTRIRYVSTIAGTTPSFTRSVLRLQISQGTPTLCQLIDRTISLTTLNSTTPSLYCDGSSSAMLEINLGAASTPPAIQLEGSTDNVTFYNIGSPLTGVASVSTVAINLNAHSAKFIRGKVSTIGVTVTAGYILIKAY